MLMELKEYVGLVLMVFLLSNVAVGQKLTIKLADKAFYDFSFDEAIDLYSYVHKRDPDCSPIPVSFGEDLAE